MADPASTPAASDAPPPGYASETLAPPGGTDPGAALFWFAVTLVAASIAAAHELAATQPAVFLDAGYGPPRWLAAGAGFASAMLGVFFERRAPGAPRDRLPGLLALTSLVTTTSAWALHFGFASPRAFAIVTIGVPALGGLALGAALSAFARSMGATLLALGGVPRALDPFRLGGIALGLGLGAALAAAVGMLRTAAAVGLVFATLAGWSGALLVFLERRAPARMRLSRGLSGGALAIGFAALIGAEAIVPITDLAQHQNQIAFAAHSERGSYVVTSGQAALELFVEGRLTLSSVDERRYHEALVHPAMLSAARRERVLVLGAGHGAVAREVLRHQDVREIVLVVPDAKLVELARRLAWLSQLSERSLESPKLRVIEREAVVWLGEASETFDVVIVDVPDPGSYVDAKNYSRHFYELLSARLSRGGVAVVQATSPFGSPLTFASVVATIRASGLETRAYRAPVPTFGDWGFVLCAPEPLAAPPPELESWLSGTTLAESFRVPADSAAQAAPQISTLHDPTVLETFARERAHLGL